MVDSRSLNDIYRNVAGEEIVRSIIANAKKPIATSKFGPNAEPFIKLLTQISPTLPIVWIDVVFDNLAFRENMYRLKRKYQINVIELRASSTIINKYRKSRLSQKGTQTFFQFQQNLKVEPFKEFCETYTPDFWMTDIRRDDTDYRNTIEKFSCVDGKLIKVAPFLNDESYKFNGRAEVNRQFNDICKPEPHMECGLHNNY